MQDRLRASMARVQERLAVWVVLTICLLIVQKIIGWVFLQYVIWLAVVYVAFLVGLWLYLAWQRWHQ